jgi:hypothetical protein
MVRNFHKHHVLKGACLYEFKLVGKETLQRCVFLKALASVKLSEIKSLAGDETARWSLCS